MSNERSPKPTNTSGLPPLHITLGNERTVLDIFRGALFAYCETPTKEQVAELRNQAVSRGVQGSIVARIAEAKFQRRDALIVRLKSLYNFLSEEDRKVADAMLFLSDAEHLVERE